jgi:amino acid adenylation domain-containing protein
VAKKHPDRLAVKDRQRALTYDELNRAANRTARAIRNRIAPGNQPIAILFHPSVFPVISMLGILKHGSIYVPLDPGFPPARLAWMLDDAQAGLILTDSQGLPLAEELAQDTIPVIDVGEIDSSISDENLGLNIPPDTLAALYYTSGSSGRPKGVTHGHRNLLLEARLRARILQLNRSDRVATFHSISVLASLLTTFSTLLCAASLHPLSAKEESGRDLLDWMHNEAITVTSAKQLIRKLFHNLSGNERFPQLRAITLGGDVTPAGWVEWCRTHLSPDLIRVGLASTEAGTIAQYLIDRAVQIPEGSIPAGYGVEDKEVLLLDEEGQEVDEGQAGEIAVRSRYVSPGYWRQPDLTQTSFLPDPQGGDKRIYLTGDLGRRLPDGCLVHMGRKDSQVKIRGYRVEVQEIEHALLALETIRAAAVVAVEDQASEDRRLVAYLVSQVHPPPTVTALRGALAKKLPDYMLPSTYVFLNALPRTLSGKVDRRALAAPDRTRPNLATAFVGPRNPVEETLVAIWEEVLDLEQVGIHDSFFELGGHSLLATRVQSRLRDALQVEIPLRRIFETPTVAELAEAVQESEGHGPVSQPPRIVPLSRHKQRLRRS